MSIWDCPACLADDDGCSCSLTMVPPTERDGITVGDKVTLVARHGARYPVEVIGFTGLDCDVEVRWLGLSPFTGSPTNTVCRRDLAAIEKPQPPASDSPASVSPEQTPSPAADSAHSGASSATPQRAVGADWQGAVVCYTRCWPCQTAQCPGGEHRWADQDDIEHAVSIGRPETAEGICGCPCAKGPVLDEPEPPDIHEVSIDGPPCHLCGAPGACGYDAEGRAYIHASYDEDDQEPV